MPLSRTEAEMIGRYFARFASAFLVIAFACLPVYAQSAGQTGDVLDPVTVKTDLYPANADAKKEIDEALNEASRGHKRVMLIFGGNWCYDCHVLDHALHQAEAGMILKENYLLVHVDIGEADKNLDLAKKYKIPLDKGVPAVAILEPNGDLVYGSIVGEFESARRMMKDDLLAFLQHWRKP
jgi:thiol:disulfide interchange protein